MRSHVNFFRHFYIFLVGFVMLPFIYTPCPAGDSAGMGHIRSLGRLEPDTGLIDLSSAAGEKRIQALLVEEQQTVSRGQPLVRLVGYDAQVAKIEWLSEQVKTARAMINGELALQQARTAEAKIRQEMILSQDTYEIKILEYEIASLTSAQEFHKLEMERAKALSNKKMLPFNTYDQRKMEMVQSQEALHMAEARLILKKILIRQHQEASRLEQENILAESRVREIGIGLENLERQLVMAQKDLENYVISSPVDGVILTVLKRAGEVPGMSPILKMADLRTMVAVAEVYETDLAHVRQGQKAVVTSPALPKELAGEVVTISRLIFKRTIKEIDPYQPADFRVAEVRIRLDDPETASRYIYLQVDVSIQGTP